MQKNSHHSPLKRTCALVRRYDRHPLRLFPIACVAFLSLVSTVAADEVPKFDVAPSCRAGEKVGINATNVNAFAACMQKEKQARDQLEANWAKFTQEDKARCIATCKCGGLTPSYVELLTCLEMANDVRRLHRGDGPDSNPSTEKR
jgi:hypothetical protein